MQAACSCSKSLGYCPLCEPGHLFLPLEPQAVPKRGSQREQVSIWLNLQQAVPGILGMGLPKMPPSQKLLATRLPHMCPNRAGPRGGWEGDNLPVWRHTSRREAGDVRPAFREADPCSAVNMSA